MEYVKSKLSRYLHGFVELSTSWIQKLWNWTLYLKTY